MNYQVVNLKYGHNRHIEIIQYPDGQQNIKLDMEYFNNVKLPIHIHCSISVFRELECLLGIVAAFRKNDFYVEEINFKYLFGMRSDRAFEHGMPNYFRDVIAPIINGMHIPHIKILCPHSKLALSALYHATMDDYRLHDNFSSVTLATKTRISADESFARWHDLNFAAYFEKQRNDDGISLNLVKIKPDLLQGTKSILLMDDLCDGGASFIAAAEYLRKRYPDKELNLFVVHGLFTKGVHHVAQYFDKVYTTNSARPYSKVNDEWEHPKLTVFNVWEECA